MSTHTEIFMLPLPPSLSHYWATVQGRRVLSKAGRAYRHAVGWVFHVARPVPFSAQDRLAVQITYYFPTRRRCDLDNYCKCLLDALVHCHLLGDDSQIDALYLLRGDVRPHASTAEVKIWALE